MDDMELAQMRRYSERDRLGGPSSLNPYGEYEPEGVAGAIDDISPRDRHHAWYKRGGTDLEMRTMRS